MTDHAPGPVISLMLAVPDASAATDWYATALGATELWNLGSVVGLQIAGAPFFLAEPENNGWNSPSELGTTTVRIEVFLDDWWSCEAWAWSPGRGWHLIWICDWID